jgi:hypothetical protein
VYAVWALLLVQLALLEGFGFQRGLNGSGTAPDGLAPFHQRMYQLAACSLFLFVFRLPPAKRWIADKQPQTSWLCLASLITGTSSRSSQALGC